MIIQITIEVLEQLEQHISQLTATQYAKKLDIFNGSSIGGHTRHIIEFYECLIKSIDTDIVNYDARERDFQIENNLNYTLEILKKIKYKLLINSDIDKNIFIEAKFGANVCNKIATSFQREAVYLIEHTIHHFALIRIGLQTNFQQVKIDKNFGVAYSTVEFQETRKRA